MIDQQTEAFGRLLRQYREARTMVAHPWPGTWNSRMVTRTLSQNELAHRAGVDPALVSRLESGGYWKPRRKTIIRLAVALDLDDEDAARLLISAGYWPWPGNDEMIAWALEHMEASAPILEQMGVDPS